MSLLVTILSLVATQIMVSFVLWVYYRANRDLHSAFWWSACLFSVALGWLINIGRGFAPEWIVVILSNSAFLYSPLALLAGTQSYFGKRVSLELMLMWWLLSMVALLFYLFVYDDIIIRVILSTLAMLVPLLVSLGMFIRFFRFSAAFVGTILSLSILIVSLSNYVGHIIYEMPSASEYRESFGSIALYVVQPGATIGFGLFGLLLLMLRLDAKLLLQSRQDYMTSVLNRYGFTEHCEGLVETQQRNQEALSLMYLDLDFFKQINERWGHQIADEILVGSVSDMSTHFGEDVVICRYSGVKFLLLAKGQNSAYLQACSARLRSYLGKNPLKIQGIDVVLSYSAGFADLSASDKNVESLIDRAEILLLQAKEQGGGQDCLPA